MASINFDFSSQSEKRKINNYYFKDLTVPIKFNNNSYDLKDSIDEEAVKNVLKNIFSFKKGERLLLPEFGNPFNELIYEPLDDKYLSKVSSAVQNAISKWEPRIEVLRVNVTPNEDQNEVYVSIVYRFKYKDIIGNYNIAVT